MITYSAYSVGTLGLQIEMERLAGLIYLNLMIGSFFMLIGKYNLNKKPYCFDISWSYKISYLKKLENYIIYLYILFIIVIQNTHLIILNHIIIMKKNIKKF